MAISDQFQWWPLGGLGEVGMNCMVFRFGELVVPVDAGVLFADANDFGIEVTYPDYRGFLLTYRPRYWIITHGHEDHIGAVSAVLLQCEETGVPPPIFYAPPFAAELIRAKLLDAERIRGGGRFLERIRSVPTDSTVEIEDVSVQFLETRHSIPDTCSIAFEWHRAEHPLRIVHTSDFKLDHRRFEDGVRTVALYDAFGGAPADVLFIDSTNAEREGHSVSETEILSGLEKLLQEAAGRVYVTLFASNVYRMAQLMKMAAAHGRFVCLAGRSLQTAFEKARDLGLLGRALPDVSGVRMLGLNEIGKHPRSAQFVICSGSQGENRSTLMRIAQGQHADFRVEPGDDVIFSSKTIPGNEKAAGRVLNGLIRQGAHVHTGGTAEKVIHASGHARRDEIRAVARTLRPRHLVPVHGELRQLTACVDAVLDIGGEWGLTRERCHVVENGTRLDFVWHDGAWDLLARRRPAEAPGRMLRFEHFSASSTDPFLKARKRAALGGIVSAWITSGGAIGVQAKGVLPAGERLDLRELERWLASRYPVLSAQDAFAGARHDIETELAEELARLVRRLHGVRPFALVHLVQNGDA